MKGRKVNKSEEGNRLASRPKKSPKLGQQAGRRVKNYSSITKLSTLHGGDQLGANLERSMGVLPAGQQTHTCAGCKEHIHDRYLLEACNKFWHDSCLKCDRCQAKLGELGSTLYEKASMNLCRQDYFEMFGRKSICSVCDKLIYASEMVMRAKENVYHLECFACQLCGLRFCVGDRFHLFENKIVCQYDYDEHLLPMQESMQEQQEFSMAMRDTDCTGSSSADCSELAAQLGERVPHLEPEQSEIKAEPDQSIDPLPDTTTTAREDAANEDKPGINQLETSEGPKD